MVFSGNHCVFANHRCKANKKIFYAHSLPKDLYSELYIGTNSNFFLNIFKKLIKKKFKKNIFLFDEILFNSNKTKSKFLFAFPELEKKIKLNVFYPFSNLNFINRSIKKINSKYLVINSRHSPMKNITKTLIDFLQYLNDTDITIYVTHEGKISKFLENQFKDYSKKIIFKGYLKFEDYQNLLNQSLGVIFPSLDEDFGISALDAYNLDIPVVLYRNCGFAEILSNNYEFFINNQKTDQIINKLLKYRESNLNVYKNKVNLKKISINNFKKYL